MKIYRDMAMIAVGVMGTLVFQKYKEPMMKKMECIKDKILTGKKTYTY